MTAAVDRTLFVVSRVLDLGVHVYGERSLRSAFGSLTPRVATACRFALPIIRASIRGPRPGPV